MYYFDNNATTKLRESSIKIAMEFLNENQPSNPSSVHYYGQNAKTKVEKSRRSILNSLLPNHQNEFNLIFTSGCTESNNQILKTFTGKQIIIGPNEHSSVNELLKELQAFRFQQNTDEEINLNKFEQSIKEIAGHVNGLFLVSISYADSEIGIIQNIYEISEIVHKYGGLLHSDITACIGKIPLYDINKLDYITYSGHKIGAINGSSALIYKKQSPLKPLILGGGQERNLRAGTENVMSIMTLAQSTSESEQEAAIFSEKTSQIKEYFENKIIDMGGEIIASKANRLPHTSMIAFPSKDARSQLIQLDTMGFMASSGSACNAGASKISDMLNAISCKNLSDKCIRFSFSSKNTIAEIDELINAIKQILRN